MIEERDSTGAEAALSSQAWLECPGCGAQYPLAPSFAGCSRCARAGKRQPLEVRYPLAKFAPDETQSGIWRWRRLLPPLEAERRVTLKEGRTPLLLLQNVWPYRDAVSLYIKNETVNPTWSWKDRPNSVSISVALSFGFQRVLAKSTGNHGASVAAYASAAGLESTIFCHPDAPDLQLALMQGYGARVTLGGDQDALIRHLLHQENYFPATILCPRAGYCNPYGVEGFKTIAFEIAEEFGWTAPDRVFVSVGSGDGIYGIWKGFRELLERGRIAKVPRVIACQASGADTLVRAWTAGDRTNHALQFAESAALSVSEPITGDHALHAVYDSHGSAIRASDAEIAGACQRLQRTGLALELASALAYRCAETTAEREKHQLKGRPERWVVVGSGAAVKWPDSLMKNYQRPNAFDSASSVVKA